MNIAEILKDCPKGTKLYSPICGECYFDIVYGTVISIKRYTANNNFKEKTLCFDEYGRLDLNGECVLFPSKEDRDWSTFKLNLKFKKGDFVYYINYVDEAWISIHKKFNGDGNIDTFVDFNCDTCKVYFDEILDDGLECGISRALVHEARPATDEEKQKVLKAIDENGYVWDEEKLELRKKEY